MPELLPAGVTEGLEVEGVVELIESRLVTQYVLLLYCIVKLSCDRSHHYGGTQG